MRNTNGFTLVELAIVMIIVGLLVGMGSSMVGVLTSAIKVRESKETLEGASQSLTSYAAGSNNLPSGATFTSTVKNPQDAWGRDILYLYDPNLNAVSPASLTKDTICGRRTTTLTLQTLDPAATIPNVAFVLLSAGSDASVQTTLNTNGTVTAKLDGINVTSGSTILLGTKASAAGKITVDARTSDDIVRWVTLDELRSKMGCQGGQLKIINNEVPFGNYSTQYLAAFTPDGGTGGYEWRILSKQLPRGIASAPAVGLGWNTGTFANTSSSTWGAANTLTLSGWPRPSGSYSLTVMVRDNSGNSASKPFVFTVNPN
ncbi:prepilin-type N-terminal cleavage/methylation domain-containing protein [Geobacter sp. SVR]|uniref:prepilin-type N-terminal cleavage/methylation domain-containing protein n=1 Tax=Geobacter sp. SVR TaxID=2495594 RepID=UPI0015669642|nr:prepilin-type N-terminal cleavage/methylation domain-containing protein [Geobacter sp. SVR]